MDPRKYKSGAVETPPEPLESPSEGYPSPGNPASGIPATVPGAYHMYAITEEMRNVIVQAGLTPDYEDLTQFSQAIQTLVAPKASQAEVDAGTIDTKFVTPQKLRFGFSSLFSTNGYVAFPSWLGGFIIQWGYVTGVTTTGTPYNFPMAFTTACYGVFVQDQGSSAAANVSYHAVDGIGLSSVDIVANNSSGGSAFFLAVGK